MLLVLMDGQKNFPCALPDDLKRFFTITNGLSVKWFAPFRGAIMQGDLCVDCALPCRVSLSLDQHAACLPREADRTPLVGHFTLNSIQDMQRCCVRKFPAFCRAADQHRIATKTVSQHASLGVSLLLELWCG